jgi:multidrug resistance efflux pump
MYKCNFLNRLCYKKAKHRRRLELERDEFQQALEDAESALELEESKNVRAQVELAQIRAEIEKRIAEKEEEWESGRKNLMVEIFIFNNLLFKRKLLINNYKKIK